MIGATAAIALPPQIAVPTVIRIEAVLFTPSIRPASNPAVNANAMLTAVYTNPLRPARNTSCRFIPNPSPTTDACSKYLVAVRDSACHGCVKPNPKINPSASAAAGDTSPHAHNANPTRNKIFTATKISHRQHAPRKQFRPRSSLISLIPPRCSPPAPPTPLPRALLRKSVKIHKSYPSNPLHLRPPLQFTVDTSTPSRSNYGCTFDAFLSSGGNSPCDTLLSYQDWSFFYPLAPVHRAPPPILFCCLLPILPCRRPPICLRTLQPSHSLHSPRPR